MVVVCTGCDKPIMDRFLMNVADQTWHPSCVSCADCGTSLTEKCFSRDGRLYCRDDFFRQFGTKCAGCNNGISPNELVRKARDCVYHLNCFVCLACKKPLSTGQELYVINDSSFLCKEDYIKNKVNNGETGELEDTVFENEQIDAQSDIGDLSDKEASFDGDQITSPITEESFKDCHRIPNNNNDIVRSEKDSGSDKEECNSVDDSNGNKRRGPRTTIKAKQLEVLKAAFSATPKPTRHIREQLASETGLNMRVIQVWFQNRRSKERRLKQMNTMGGRRPFFGRSGRRMRGSHIDDSPDIPPHYGFFPQDGQTDGFYPPGMYSSYPGAEFYHNNTTHQTEPANFIANPTTIIDMPALSHSGPTHENNFIPSDLSQSSPEQAMMVSSSMSGDTHFSRNSVGPYSHLTQHHQPIESW